MPNPDTERDPHRWFRERLDANVLGLLDESESERFFAHASECPACGVAMKSHAEHLPLARGDGHIPSGFLARWDRTSVALRGMPRRLVREHLQDCPSCRQDLEALGYVAVLDVVPELEGDSASPDDSNPYPIPRPGMHEIRIVQGIPRTQAGRWRSWVFGGLAGAAAACIALLLVFPDALKREVAPSPGEPSRPPTSPPAVTAPVTPETAGRFVLDLLPGASQLSNPSRGGESAKITVNVADGARYALVRLPGLFLDDSTEVAITLVDAQGKLLAEARHPYGEIASRRTLLLGRSESALEPGHYRLIITPQTSPGTPGVPSEFRIVVRRRAH